MRSFSAPVYPTIRIPRSERNTGMLSMPYFFTISGRCSTSTQTSLYIDRSNVEKPGSDFKSALNCTHGPQVGVPKTRSSGSRSSSSFVLTRCRAAATASRTADEEMKTLVRSSLLLSNPQTSPLAFSNGPPLQPLAQANPSTLPVNSPPAYLNVPQRSSGPQFCLSSRRP